MCQIVGSKSFSLTFSQVKGLNFIVKSSFTFNYDEHKRWNAFVFYTFITKPSSSTFNKVGSSYAIIVVKSF
jgi:hypothetical protein